MSNLDQTMTEFSIEQQDAAEDQVIEDILDLFEVSDACDDFALAVCR